MPKLPADLAFERAVNHLREHFKDFCVIARPMEGSGNSSFIYALSDTNWAEGALNRLYDLELSDNARNARIIQKDGESSDG